MGVRSPSSLRFSSSSTSYPQIFPLTVLVPQTLERKQNCPGHYQKILWQQYHKIALKPMIRIRMLKTAIWIDWITRDRGNLSTASQLLVHHASKTLLEALPCIRPLARRLTHVRTIRLSYLVRFPNPLYFKSVGESDQSYLMILSPYPNCSQRLSLHLNLLTIGEYFRINRLLIKH